MIEGYKKMRNSQKLDNQWLFNYYKKKGGEISNVEQFLDIFYYESVPIMVNGLSFGVQKHNRDLGNFFEDMDKQLNLTTLWNKDGNFLKVL